MKTCPRINLRYSQIYFASDLFDSMEMFDFDHVTAQQILVYSKLSKFVRQWLPEVMIWKQKYT